MTMMVVWFFILFVSLVVFVLVMVVVATGVEMEVIVGG